MGLSQSIGPIARRHTKGEAEEWSRQEEVGAGGDGYGGAACREWIGGGEATEGARMGRIRGEAPCSQFIFFGQSGVDPFTTP